MVWRKKQQHCYSAWTSEPGCFTRSWGVFTKSIQLSLLFTLYSWLITEVSCWYNADPSKVENKTLSFVVNSNPVIPVIWALSLCSSFLQRTHNLVAEPAHCWGGVELQSWERWAVSTGQQTDFGFKFSSVFVFSCPEQLNRWPCHSVSH